MEVQNISMPPLQAFELPFAYVEADEKKQALVKVKVCEKCARKITYKPSGDRGTSQSHADREGAVSEKRANATEEGRRPSSKTSTRNREERHARRSESPRRR